MVAVAVNAAVALLVLVLLPRRSLEPRPRERAARPSRLSPGRLRWAMACAAAAGFASLAWEVLWLRVYTFATGGTIAIFGLFLGVYLAGIAVGAALARHACRAASPGAADQLLARAAFGAAAGGVVGYLHAPCASWIGAHGTPIVAVFVAAVAGAMYGSILPLVTHHAVVADERTGRGVSYVYLANIVGSALGATLTGFVFLHSLGMAGASALLLAVSGGLAAALLWVRAGSRSRRGVAVAVCGTTIAPLLLGPVLYDALYERLLWKTPDAAEHRFVHQIENRAGVVSVSSGGTVYGSGVYDGWVNVRLDGDRYRLYRAYALAALRPGARRVLMIGMGSGSWAQVVAHLPSLEELVVVEINDAYFELAGRLSPVRSLLTNPKVTLVQDDGRRWLKRAEDERFDAIVINTTFHWRAGVTHLLSVEFHALAASRLAPDGILYFNTTGSTDAMRTACTTFRSGLRFANFMAVGDGAVDFDVEAFEAAIRSYRIDGEPGVADPDAWLREHVPRLLDPNHTEPCPRVLERTAGYRVITDDNLASESRFPWYVTYSPGAPD